MCASSNKRRWIVHLALSRFSTLTTMMDFFKYVLDSDLSPLLLGTGRHQRDTEDG
jgi:hypothetical protein